MIGQRFGRWTVLSESPERKNRKRMYLCRCDCGTESIVCGGNLRSGISKSCGCLKLQRIHETRFLHGKNTQDRAYRIWIGMRSRCSSPRNKKYSRYGGRGIKVCERWSDFRLFLQDMGDPPKGTSIDRIDNDGNYEPSNCRWATPAEQSRNTSVNRWIEYGGLRMCAEDWGKRLGLTSHVLIKRLKQGWTEKEAIEGRRLP